jgi:hypothetical protein
MEVFARGVRNSVGFDWDPATRELWFTDNGRDMLGDDVPPDELNHAPRDLLLGFRAFELLDFLLQRVVNEFLDGGIPGDLRIHLDLFVERFLQLDLGSEHNFALSFGF